jgi:hypothetical protein
VAGCSIRVDVISAAVDHVEMTIETEDLGKRALEEAISRLLHGRRDPAANRKAREDMNRMREETRRRIGTLNVAFELIRDARNP